MLGLQVPHGEGELRQRAGGFARDDPFREPGGVGIGALDGQRHERPVVQLGVARVVAQRFAVEERGGAGVARRSGHDGGEEVAGQRVSGVDRIRIGFGGGGGRQGRARGQHRTQAEEAGHGPAAE